jgi:predicted Zn-dependent peptidase
MHRLPPSDELDHAGLDLLVALLADGESSPIPETLVKRTRLCVHAGAQSFKLLHGGALIFFGAFLPPGKGSARRAVIRDICDRLAAEGPDVAEFERRLRRFRRNRAAESYSAHRRMLGLGEAEMLQGSYRRYEEALDDLAAVTPERVRDLARELFAADNTLDLDIIPEKTRWWMPLAGLFMKVRPR